jgi:hypothetical protein
LHLYETFTAFVENGKEYYYFGAKMWLSIKTGGLQRQVRFQAIYPFKVQQTWNQNLRFSWGHTAYLSVLSSRVKNSTTLGMIHRSETSVKDYRSTVRRLISQKRADLNNIEAEAWNRRLTASRYCCFSWEVIFV